MSECVAQNESTSLCLIFHAARALLMIHPLILIYIFIFRLYEGQDVNRFFVRVGIKNEILGNTHLHTTFTGTDEQRGYTSFIGMNWNNGHVSFT